MPYIYPNGRRRPERPWNHIGMFVIEGRTDLGDKDYTEDVKPFGQDKEDDKEDDKYEKVCYTCHRPENKIGSITSMPGGINLCHDCIQKASDLVTKKGMDSSKLPNMLCMNMSLNNLNVVLPTVETPKKQKIKKKSQEQPVLTMKSIPAPYMIEGELDEYVVGQEKVKRVVPVAAYNHYRRTFLDGKAGQEKENVENTEPDGMVIEKSNILMIRPIGSRKTYLVKALVRLLGVPLAIVDATSLTGVGRIDGDIGGMVSKLLAATDNDVERVQRGIIFVDGTDETAKRKQINIRNISDESAQWELLKLLEGDTVEVPVGSSQKNIMTPMATVNMDNILFICGGAFSDLEEIIKERFKKESSMGLGSVLKDTYDSDPNILSHVTDEDLRTFGTISEFLGRLPVTMTLRGLTEDMMARILKEPRSAITKQCEKSLLMDKIRLVSKDGAPMWITEEALKRGADARALWTILKELMLDIMYEVPKNPNIDSVVVTHPYLEKNGGPLIQMRR